MDLGETVAAPPAPESPAESTTPNIVKASRRWNERRLAVAQKLFEGYDVDHSGTMELEEFLPLMQRYDVSVDENAVKLTFAMAGGDDGAYPFPTKS